MIGKTVSHYDITGKLGEGGMGVVYEAYDTVLKRKVALKFLPAGITRDEDSKKRFIREAQAAAALDHPNICTVHEIGEDDGHTFIVMPRIEGAGLADRVKDGPLPLDDALDIAIQIARGLAKAHRNDIVHRDIKPGNILITEDGHVKIVDFGLAKLGAVSKMTVAGTTLGTVSYMSPEQAGGEDVDHRSDIWALGVVLHEMLSGRMPFRGEVDAAVIYSIMNEKPLPLAEACPDCPEDLARVIGMALAKEPGERFQTMDEMAQALEAVRGGRAVPLGGRRRAGAGDGFRRLLIPGFLVTITMIVALVGYWFLGRGHGIEAVAVLPLIEHSTGGESDGFADGFTGTLITELGRLGTLRLTGHRSVMRYRDSEKSLTDIATELGVDALIDGEIVRDGDNLLLTVGLWAVDPERQLWTESFNRRFEDVLALYAEVTRAIAEQVNAAVSPAAGATMDDRGKVDPKAHENYILGIGWLNASISYDLDGDIGKAKRHFEAALAIDSTYAPAWAGLAEVHIMSSHAAAPPEHAVESAIECVEKALALDPNESDAYRTKAHILWEHEFDMSGGREAMERGLELNPSDAYLTLIKSIYLMCVGELEKGAEFAKRALELDPLSGKINQVAWWPIGAAGRTEDALTQIDRLNTLLPKTRLANNKVADRFDLMAWVYALNGEYDRAIEIWESSGVQRGDEGWSYFLFEAAVLHHLAGRPEKAQEMLDEYDGLIDIETMHYWRRAQYYALRGDMDKAFEILEDAYEDKFWYITRLTIEYRLIPLRDDPRFMDLARRIGIR